MEAIKPIETRYKGYRFRSRLEARWAVFFDAMGIKYEYEKEGYDLGKAGWYLPDFWLPEMKTFLEIKPTSPELCDHEKLERLRDGIGAPAGMCVGMPCENTITCYAADIGDSSGGSSTWTTQFSVINRLPVFVVLDFMPSSKSIVNYHTWKTVSVYISLQDYANRTNLGFVPSTENFLTHLDYLYNEEPRSGSDRHDVLVQKRAIRAARAARFEHGEHPDKTG